MKRKKEQPKANKKKTIKPVTSADRKPKTARRVKFFKFTYNENKFSLTQQQKSFCDLWLDPENDYLTIILGAGYVVTNAEGVVNKHLANTMYKENLLKPAIKAYIQMNYEALGLTKENVDREHAFVLVQRSDLSSKNKAIDMYHKIHGNYVADSAEAKVNSELADALARIRNEIPD